ncbi:TPA: transketolase [Candidatus Poribacteria bacterium]|nr:transketolase [Candidatus Poribacteria bacterium]HIB88224.1 transketolase [Candidatus Poribacteria bacterium]HIB98687.1 transketolase [Candidatus Poribacteria bacterium]HIO05516.1 transketolase [Candidatus Poribacteria bacterium]HIO82269.1 transketolase [Candidatus Poribacteria bacterium]
MMIQSSDDKITHLEEITRRIRGELVQISHMTNTPHLGSSLSCVDILVAAYWMALNIDPADPLDLNRDRFILSKGHAAPALYTALAYRGFFPIEQLQDYAKPGSLMAEHPSWRSVPGVEATTGSLGHGLSIGLGMAIAGRIQYQSYHVFVVISDGECNEGTIWEAAMLASAQGLNKLVVIVDFNKWQATGRSREVMAIDPLKAKWEAFGWSTYETDGHDLKTLVNLLTNVPDSSGKPIAIVAHTVKGKGVSFMEDDNNWHYRIPTVTEVELAKRELHLI